MINGLHEPFPATAMFQICHEQLCHILPTYDLHDIFHAQQIIAREHHQRVHDALAVAPQDICAVGDTKRLAENGRDCKPVREAADRSR